MNKLRTLAYALHVALLLAAGCGSPLVGLECDDNYTRCGSSCVSLSDDINNCGACGNVCSAGQQCVAQMCTTGGPQPDGGEGGTAEGGLSEGGVDGGDGGRDGGDGSVDAGDGGGRDGGDGSIDIDANIGGDGGDGSIQGDGSIGGDGDVDIDGSAGDGGLQVEVDGNIITLPPPLCTPIGEADPADCTCDLTTPTRCPEGASTDYVCVDLSTNNGFCGDCTTVCPVSQYCSNGMCADICQPPTTFCNGVCADLQTSDQYCGSCTNACGPLQACVAGMCTGRAVGHVVLIGHDLTGIVRPNIPRLLGNAVFLARGTNTRVLVLNQFTTPESVAGFAQAMAVASVERGRAFTPTLADPARLREQLADTDAFVINVQQGADDATLQGWGSDWAAALDDFLFRGGVIVVIDAGGGSNAGTYQVLSNALVSRPGGVVRALLPVTAKTAVPAGQMGLTAPGDALAQGMPTEYPSEGTTAGFAQAAVSNAGVAVVRPLTGPGMNGPEAIVIHNTVTD